MKRILKSIKNFYDDTLIYAPELVGALIILGIFFGLVLLVEFVNLFA